MYFGWTGTSFRYPQMQPGTMQRPDVGYKCTAKYLGKCFQPCAITTVRRTMDFVFARMIPVHNQARPSKNVRRRINKRRPFIQVQEFITRFPTITGASSL